MSVPSWWSEFRDAQHARQAKRFVRRAVVRKREGPARVSDLALAFGLGLVMGAVAMMTGVAAALHAWPWLR
jgi:hypothetical protein